MKRSIVYTIGLTTIAALAGCTSQVSKPGIGIILADLDTTVSPAADFFTHANGGWIKAHPIPDDQVRWGSFSILAENNKKQIREIVEEASKKADAKKGSAEQMVGDFYFSAMDTVTIEKQGASPIKADMEAIDKLADMNGILNYTAKLQMWGGNPMFGFYAGQDPKNTEVQVPQLVQGGLSLPDRDYYLKNDEDSKKIRDEFVLHISKMFQLYGMDETASKKYASVILGIETELAKASMPREEMRDPFKTYHKVSLADLDMMTPSLKWADMLSNMEVKGKFDYVILGQPEFLKALEKQLAGNKIDDWKIYLKWNLLNLAGNTLSHDFVMEDFHFNSEILSGQKKIKERWNRMVSFTDGYLGDALGQLYVAKYFPPDAKKKADELVSNLMVVYKDRITKLDWMGEETKKKALEKLGTIVRKIGYPDKWKDYEGVEITRDNFFANLMSLTKYNYQYMINKIGQPVDRTEWGMTPPTVNAYYNPLMNEIVFPAGILQPPFFNKDADDAVNYGGIGMVIGHEITHGFDDEGRNYDSKGNLTQWWTSEDSAKFSERAQLIVDQYSQYVVNDSLHVNGKLCLGENIADIGGLTIAYHAFKNTEQGKGNNKIDGLTPDQRFFLGFAHVWAGSIRPKEAARRIITDPHSPGNYRVNGSTSNMPEFYAAFGVKEGDLMWRNDSIRAKIW
ncbi:MAG: M13 family metallopeptidase [Bacteroidetes bacterium]|nr:M13 family metallopeptidase [Bacteroidota bacterium]